MVVGIVFVDIVFVKIVFVKIVVVDIAVPTRSNSLISQRLFSACESKN